MVQVKLRSHIGRVSIPPVTEIAEVLGTGRTGEADWPLLYSIAVQNVVLLEKLDTSECLEYWGTMSIQIW